MALDHLQNSGLTRAVTDLLADLAELLQKELQLAKTEITEKITSRLRASAWMVAGILGMIAALLVVEAAVFALSSFGLALHWSCLLVAAVLIAIAAAAFFHGRSLTDDELLPSRTADRSRKTSRQPRNNSHESRHIRG